MKIVSVDAIQLKRLDVSAQTPVLCRINTDEGIYGYGEAGVSIFDYSIGAYQLIKLMAKMIIGMDPLDTDAVYHKLSGNFWAQGNGGVIMAAISAIDTALWDIKGKFFGVPCCKLLGGVHRTKLRAYASQLQFGWKSETFMASPGDVGFLQDACRAAVEDGYDAVKIDLISKKLDGKPTSSEEMHIHFQPPTMRELEKKLDACRQALGPQVDIILENHNGTTAMTAIEFARMAEPYDIMFLEEPASPLSPMDYQRIAAHTHIPLATGERTYTRRGFLPLFQTGCLSVAQPDLGNCGGYTEGRKICDMAEAFSISVQTHTCNTPISVAAALQFEAAIPNFIIHEHHTVNTLKEVTDLCVYNDQPVDGYFEVPDRPGIGNELSEKALAEAVAIETVKGA